MEHSVIKLGQKKHIALVAHDGKKQDLLEWARWNKNLLIEHELYATGTTGRLLEEVLGTTVHKFRSGPLGGDQQIGAKISEGLIDFMIFFWDPLTEQPHDADVKALLRIAVVWNIPTACNRASADFMISSTLMTDEYDRLVTNYQSYVERQVAASIGNTLDEMGVKPEPEGTLQPNEEPELSVQPEPHVEPTMGTGFEPAVAPAAAHHAEAS